MGLSIESFAVDATLRTRLGELEDDSFPAYLNEEPTWLVTQDAILTEFDKYHFLIVDDASGKAAAVSVNVPLAWDGQASSLPGYNELLELSLQQAREGRTPTALVGILGAVSPDFRGQGVTELFNQGAAEILARQGISRYLSPVRPSNKQHYPNYTMEEFLSWRTPDGGLVDPWLNHFMRMGATELGIAHDAITLSASIEQWTAWTGMLFPVSGDYVIPGGHRMLRVDTDAGTARYGEDHLWYEIPLAAPLSPR
jgi:hypothetical protein